jgi:phytase-like protein
VYNMKIVLLFFLLISAITSFEQKQSIIQVNDTLTAHRYEFSALAKWHNKIVLVPQNRRNVIDSIYMIDSAEIDQSLQQNTIAKHTSFAIKNLRHVGVKKDSLYINDILLGRYDGFEAATVKDDTIFFSFEADTSFCYLVKGLINEQERSINILPDTLHVPDTYNINNAGFESLALLPHKDSLLAFFECNKDTIHAKAFMFSTSLKGKAKPLQWRRPLYFRLTDVYALSDSELIGINRLYTSKNYPYERDAYIKCESLSTVERQLTNGGNIDTCFAQIIKLTLVNNKIDWQPVAFVSLADADNYEGIVPFKDGVLIIVDGEPGNNPCNLVFVTLE